MKTQSRERLVKLVKIAVLSAIATIVMLFEIPLWFAPEFYKLDFSEVIVLIGAFSLGPVAGIIIEFIKIMLNFMINGTITGGIGELANFIIGVSFVLPASLIYKYRKRFSGAVIGMVVGTLIMTLLGGVINYFILLPVYSKVLGFPLDDFVKMGSEVNMFVKDLKSLVIFAVTPFNLFKGIISSMVVLLIYKKISGLLKGK